MAFIFFRLTNHCLCLWLSHACVSGLLDSFSNFPPKIFYNMVFCKGGRSFEGQKPIGGFHRYKSQIVSQVVEMCLKVVPHVGQTLWLTNAKIIGCGLTLSRLCLKKTICPGMRGRRMSNIALSGLSMLDKRTKYTVREAPSYQYCTFLSKYCSNGRGGQGLTVRPI